MLTTNARLLPKQAKNYIKFFSLVQSVYGPGTEIQVQLPVNNDPDQVSRSEKMKSLRNEIFSGVRIPTGYKPPLDIVTKQSTMVNKAHPHLYMVKASLHIQGFLSSFVS